MSEPHVITIEDADDPRIAGYRDIRERDLVGRAGHFIAEGEVVLRVLARATRHTVHSILVVQHRLDGVRELLALFAPGVTVYAMSQKVADRIAGFPIHRGLLALGTRAPALDVDALLGEAVPRACIVVGCAIANHDNIGGIYRNAAAFGAAGVILDSQCCDPLYRKAIRVSVGAALKVPFAAGEDAAELADMLGGTGFEQIALSPAGLADIRELARPDRLALYLGTEGDGLPKTLLARLKTARIDMSAGFDSLNVAAASAIALHHFSGGRTGST